MIWQFVPIFHLWKPYSALHEIFMVSNPDPDDNRPPRILPVFWTFWIAFLVIGQFASKLSDHPLLGIVPLAIELGNYGTASAMVMHLSRWQSEKHVAVVRLTDVLATGELLDVAVQVLGTDLMEGSVIAALEHPPE